VVFVEIPGRPIILMRSLPGRRSAAEATSGSILKRRHVHAWHACMLVKVELLRRAAGPTSFRIDGGGGTNRMKSPKSSRTRSSSARQVASCISVCSCRTPVVSFSWSGVWTFGPAAPRVEVAARLCVCWPGTCIVRNGRVGYIVRSLNIGLSRSKLACMLVMIYE
jgi:hypothetical protein